MAATGEQTDVMQVGRKLVELVDKGEHRRAIEELYADKVEVIEAMERPDCQNGVKSKEEILKASDEFFEMMDVHGGTIDGPFPMDDSFICYMTMDATAKAGPMAGQRFDMREAGVYKVADGKIVSSRYCYSMPGCEG